MRLCCRRPYCAFTPSSLMIPRQRPASAVIIAQGRSAPTYGRTVIAIPLRYPQPQLVSWWRGGYRSTGHGTFRRPLCRVAEIMSGLTIWERARVARLAAARARTGMVAGLLGSPLLRWRYGAPLAEELLMIPQELRAADPSFAAEIAQGELGLAGWVAHLEKGSPFRLVPPSEAWARELHGFAWLRHLRAAGTAQARETALVLAGEWIGRGRAHASVAWEPAVVGRRIVSWLGNAGLLLDDVERATFDRTAQSLADQLIHLSAAWRSAPDGYPRLVALIGVVYGDICIAGHDGHLKQSEALLGAELQRQILPDGGHVSRNAGVLIELMLDLLPLRQCFATANRALPNPIGQAMARMLPMLRYLRLGDGSLARFNGVGATPIAELATVLAYDAQRAHDLSAASDSRYARLERGDLVLIADVGAPPPLVLAGQAHAGCLSFEFSSRQQEIVVNCGMPLIGRDSWRQIARGTAAHSTVIFNETSSCRFLESITFKQLLFGAPIVAGPQEVTASREEREDAVIVRCSHDAYAKPFGVVHQRAIMLALDGNRLDGEELFTPPETDVKPRSGPDDFAVRFHLHPSVKANRLTDGHGVMLMMPNKEVWTFNGYEDRVELEESVFLAGNDGPRRTMQIAIYGRARNVPRVHWTFLRSAPPATNVAASRRGRAEEPELPL